MPPTRRRPGASSPIARLEPHVEEVKTPATAPEEASLPPEVPAQRQQPEAMVSPNEPVERKAVTFQLRTMLKKRIETAILRTQGLPGGHHSLAAFMDAAASRELERLEAEFNGGESYAPNAGQFRTGRPIG